MITLAGDELIAESSHVSARRTDAVGNPEVDFTYKAPSRAVEHFASPLVTQRFSPLRHTSPKEDEALLFRNLGKDLEYQWHE
jgi:hypothetical protein